MSAAAFGALFFRGRSSPGRSARPPVITSPGLPGRRRCCSPASWWSRGPTVIIPLLRQSKLSPRPAALLKWEGIVNDPIGALFAVFAFEIATLGGGHGAGLHGGAGAATPAQLFLTWITASVLSAGFGFALGRGAARCFRQGWIPEYLKLPALLALVLFCFEIANLLQEEAGLVAVTVMGVTLANARLPSINELRLFKENVAIILVSGVFVILTANLTWDAFAALDARAFMFLGAMLFVVRPVTVFASTIGAGLPLVERLLVGWIAPRGIVAVAVTSFFGAALVAFHTAALEAPNADSVALAHEIASAERLIPLAFAMVFATVVLHGFSIGPLAKALGLASRERPGVLISGATPFAGRIGGEAQGIGRASDDRRRQLAAIAAGAARERADILRRDPLRDDRASYRSQPVRRLIGAERQ